MAVKSVGRFELMHYAIASFVMRWRLGHPDYFGERALLKDDIRSATISALEDIATPQV